MLAKSPKPNILKIKLENLRKLYLTYKITSTNYTQFLRRFRDGESMIKLTKS